VGLVFIPAMVLPGAYSNPKTWTYAPGIWNTAQGGFGEGPAGARVADFGVPQQPSIDESFGHSIHLNWVMYVWFELL
jgi:hypothetical protein